MSLAESLNILSQIVLYLAFGCMIIVAYRNAVSLTQLLLAAYVFATRVKPSSASLDLWHRYADLALPISVIAPAFNEELSIVESVKALLALEYPEHEVIVVNDGSSYKTMPLSLILI